jgi:hypothetical protein
MNKADYEDLLQKLAPPKDYDHYDIDQFKLYYKDKKSLLPKWPADPFKNWLYEYYSRMGETYGHLRFDLMDFNLEEWTSERVYNDINSHIIDSIDGMGEQIIKNSLGMLSPIQKYMRLEGTWPIPIIILYNPTGIKSPRNDKSEKYGEPYHLLEGHRRLGYFRNMYRNELKNTKIAGISKLKKSHKLWVVRIKNESEIGAWKKIPNPPEFKDLPYLDSTTKLFSFENLRI